MKYINLIALDRPPSLTFLNLELKMGRYDVNSRPIQLRTEIKQGDLIHIIQILSPAEASVTGESGRLRGVLLDIDSIRPIKENDSWPDVDKNLDEVHHSSKKMFFGLLTSETIDNLEPEYEEEN